MAESEQVDFKCATTAPEDRENEFPASVHEWALSWTLRGVA